MRPLDWVLCAAIMSLGLSGRLLFASGMGLGDDFIFRGEVATILYNHQVLPDNQAYRFMWWLPTAFTCRIFGLTELGLILPFGLEPLATTLAWLQEGADIVIGDRLHPDSQAQIDVTTTRQASSVVYTWMVSRLCGLDYPDTQCGYKGYRRDVARALFPRLEVTSFAFEVEILLRAQAAGYRVRRQPLHLLHDEDSSVRLTRHAPRMLLDVLRIAWKARRGGYERHA